MAIDVELCYQAEMDRQRQLPNEMRINFINSEHWINYTQAQQVLTKLGDLINFPKRSRMPNLLVLSPTNNGKTMLIKRFMGLYPATYKSKGFLDRMDPHDYYDELPVLYVPMSSNPDLTRFYGLILHNLGVFMANSARIVVLESMVLKFLTALKTRMLIIDEFHNALSGRLDRQREFLNVLRFLGNQLEIPIIAVGIKESYLLIRLDEQLANRFEPYILPEWQYDQGYLSLLATYNKILPLKYGFDLTESGLAKKIFSKCDGKIGEIDTVIRLAAIKGINSFQDTITAETLECIEYKSPVERRQQIERLLHKTVSTH
jgi:hypothetical protein